MRGEVEQGRGEEDGVCAEQKNSLLRVSVFLSFPINLMPEGEKRRKSTTSNHIC